MRTKIALTMRITQNTSYYEIRDSISQQYIELLEKNNIIPILISNAINDPVEYFKQMGCVGLFLSGGDDIQFKYEQLDDTKNALKNLRDKTEYLLLDYCIKNNIPVFGVCRGIQMINIYNGGKLIKNNEQFNSHVNVIHEIKIVDKDFMGEYSTKFVNSYHNNIIISEVLGKDLKIFAESKDKVIEGIYIDKLLIGVQWHPEREKCEIDKFLIRKWIEWIGGRKK